MKEKLFLLLTGTALILLSDRGLAQANLLTIGTANYMGTEFNLIWDNDNNGKSVVWFDYSRTLDTYENQKSWANLLDAQLTYHIDAAYNVTWDDTDWRLASLGLSGNPSAEHPGPIYNATDGELGHLYYEELGNIGEYDSSGIYVGDGNFGLQNTGIFENLASSFYWSNVTDLPDVWGFNMSNGEAYHRIYDDPAGYGLAIRSGQVATTAPVPEPTTMLLFGTGLAGLVGSRVRKKKNNIRG